MWDDELDEDGVTALLSSYVVRTRWQAEVLSAAIIRRLAEALGGGDDTGAPAKREPKVSAARLFGEMGVKL